MPPDSGGVRQRVRFRKGLIAAAFIVGGLGVWLGFRMYVNDALVGAAGHGRTEEVVSLLRNGANVNYRFEGNLTPLFLASANGHLDTVRVLLAAGADPNIPEYDGKTALSTAATPAIREAIEATMSRAKNLGRER